MCVLCNLPTYGVSQLFFIQLMNTEDTVIDYFLLSFMTVCTFELHILSFFFKTTNWFSRQQLFTTLDKFWYYLFFAFMNSVLCLSIMLWFCKKRYSYITRHGTLVTYWIWIKYMLNVMFIVIHDHDKCNNHSDLTKL